MCLVCLSSSFEVLMASVSSMRSSATSSGLESALTSIQKAVGTVLERRAPRNETSRRAMSPSGRPNSRGPSCRTFARTEPCSWPLAR